ncbi:MAG: tetratricopeptide repeat protein [Thermoanaerobaculia bacterium]
MLCQTCGTFNSDDDADFCVRCKAKLLVVSGPRADEEGESGSPDDIAFDEHLLERISALEEVVRREGEMIRTLFESLQRLEKSLSVAQTGIVALQETLEQRGVLPPGETTDRWQARSEKRLHAVETKERLLERRDRVLAGFAGSDREGFDQKLREAELAIVSLDSDRGLRLLEDGFRLDRGNADLGFFLAETYFADGDLDRAAHFLKKVLAANPNHYETLLYSGIVASESGEARPAEMFLKKSIEIRPDAFLPHFALGGLFARQSKFSEAQRELSIAREIAPLTATRILLGQVHRELGDAARAIEEFEAAAKQDPRSDEAFFQLGIAYLEKNRPRRALEAFQSSLAINPRRLEVQEAVRVLRGGDPAKKPVVDGPAAEDFRRAEESAAAGRLRQALDLYRRALEREPDNQTVRISYALLCASLGASAEAMAACRRILAGPAEEMVATAACSTLAEALRSDGQWREATRAVEEFMKNHDSPAARTIGFYELACNLADSDGDLADALEFASRSLEAAPDELKPFSLAALGWVYYKKKEYESAVDLLKRSCEGLATPSTLHRLGMALLAADRPEEAKAAFRRAKTVASRGSGLEDRMLEQVRLNVRLAEMAAPRRKA